MICYETIDHLLIMFEIVPGVGLQKVRQGLQGLGLQKRLEFRRVAQKPYKIPEKPSEATLVDLPGLTTIEQKRRLQARHLALLSGPELGLGFRGQFRVHFKVNPSLTHPN